VPIDRDLLRRADITGAVTTELSSRNRLLPRRWDYAALALNTEAVESWLKPQLRRGPSGKPASIVFADKGWRGTRPLHVMTLEDRVLYRALVDLISKTLPEQLRSRVPMADFRQAPLDVPNVRYVTKTDVTSYYEFVDHDLLRSELIAQTGEEPAVDALSDLLQSVLGRRVGLPQVHPSSDILGDSYIDPARRRLLRAGYVVFTYSDDFRIASPTLGDARLSLESCETEVRKLGLVLNERKTYTYGAAKYKKSLTSFADAERKLFVDKDSGEPLDPIASFFFPSYGDADDASGPQTLGVSPLDRTVDEDEIITTENGTHQEDDDPQRLRAAQRAWELWFEEDESEEAQAGQDAAITQSLVGRALPTLGMAGDSSPLENLSLLLRYEPALTPQICAYLEAFGKNGQRERTKLRKAFDELVTNDVLSPWQQMWIAHVAGGLRRSARVRPYEKWLEDRTTDAHPGLAATAAAALGRIGRGDPALIAATVDRVGQEWRCLAFWGLARVDQKRATDTADDELDRLIISAVTQGKKK
jgi:hypothetical protein